MFILLSMPDMKCNSMTTLKCSTVGDPPNIRNDSCPVHTFCPLTRQVRSFFPSRDVFTLHSKNVLGTLHTALINMIIAHKSYESSKRGGECK